jgi:hypothetical protein
VATEALTVERSSPIEFHRSLRTVYGEDAADASSVRRGICHFKSGEKNTGDRPHSISAPKQLT